jgi:hypothetical protein
MCPRYSNRFEPPCCKLLCRRPTCPAASAETAAPAAAAQARRCTRAGAAARAAAHPSVQPAGAPWPTAPPPAPPCAGGSAAAPLAASAAGRAGTQAADERGGNWGCNTLGVAQVTPALLLQAAQQPSTHLVVFNDGADVWRQVPALQRPFKIAGQGRAPCWERWRPAATARPGGAADGSSRRWPIAAFCRHRRGQRAATAASSAAHQPPSQL